MVDASNQIPPDHPERIRKTVSFTHKQLGVGGISLFAALYMIEPLRDFVRNETKPQADQIVALKSDQMALKNDFTVLTTANKIELVAAIKESEGRIIRELHAIEERAEKANDRQDRSHEGLREEVAVLQSVLIKQKTK